MEQFTSTLDVQYLLLIDVLMVLVEQEEPTAQFYLDVTANSCHTDVNQEDAEPTPPTARNTIKT